MLKQASLFDADPQAFSIPCVSLWQPYASLIMAELKQFETRDWRPPARVIQQWIVIHAAQRAFNWKKNFRNSLFDVHFAHAIKDRKIDAARLPYGAALGVVFLTSFHRTEDIRKNVYRRELAFGDYGDHRVAWRLVDPRPFPRPIPLIGHQKFWNWTPEAEITIMIQRLIERKPNRE